MFLNFIRKTRDREKEKCFFKVCKVLLNGKVTFAPGNLGEAVDRVFTSCIRTEILRKIAETLGDLTR